MSQTKVKSGLLNFPDQTDSVRLPSGTTAQRPSSPSVGAFRYNTEIEKVEIWAGVKWGPISSETALPSISSISYPDSALAAEPSGGQIITINGENFIQGLILKIDNQSPDQVSFVSSSQITFLSPAKSAGTYDILITNPNAAFVLSQDALEYNGVPTWTTPSGTLLTIAKNTQIDPIQLIASEPDGGNINYSITSGALPSGLSIVNSSIQGTTPDVSINTTFNFSITATDDENQNSTERQFSILVNSLDGATPATAAGSAQDLRNNGISTSGVYWLNINNETFQTYVLFDAYDGNDWYLAFLHRNNNTEFTYDSSWWSSLGPLNDSASNLNYASNSSINVATGIVSNYNFSDIAVSFYDKDNTITNDYLKGYSSDSNSRKLNEYTSASLTMNTFSSSSDSEILLMANQEASNYSWGYNRSNVGQTVSGSSYARFGEAIASELYAGNYYSNRGYGFGLKSQNICGQTYQTGSGYSNARHNAGGCSDGPSAGGIFLKTEIWVR